MIYYLSLTLLLFFKIILRKFIKEEEAKLNH
jgi:hypothetical protein